VIHALKAVLAEKDFHNTECMKEIACLLGEAVGLSREEADRLRLLVDVCDIGNPVLAVGILLKPGPLAEEEWGEARHHCRMGYRAPSLSGSWPR